MVREIDKNSLPGILSQTTIFQHLPPEIIQLIADKMIISSCAADQLIISKGDMGDSMYIVLKGRVKVHDQEHIVAEMGDHEFFGELSLFDSEPRSMSVSAKEPSIISVIQRNDFLGIIKDHPEIIEDIIKVLTKRLRRQNRLLIQEYQAREEELKKLVVQRTSDLEKKNLELTEALDNLERSQLLLVQQARLASLGQLTAGIAHEIQNPLNFVNNFSELSEELVDEIEKANSDEERNELLADLKKNLGKIHQHGKRAAGIVRNMLAHSRTSSGEKQQTDINFLCEEAFNLAYHGMRAHHLEFNCKLEKRFDEKLPKLNVVPQDISRVLLNLYNNAFYAINEKRSQLPTNELKKEYQPKISLTTQAHKDSITISVHDNGSGIPHDVKEKIFLSFFTTKPTGEGTGLGLSISNDIITAHGGKIKVESEIGKYTEFTITLPR